MYAITFTPSRRHSTPLSLLLLTAAMAVSHLAHSCEFPSHIQSNSTLRHGGVSRDWRGRIRNQYTEFTLQISVSHNVIKTVSTDATARSHTRACVRALAGGKYLVAHEESGQQGNKFACIQFVMRSADVMQIRASSVSDRMNLSLCGEDRLVLDKWLVVDRTHVGRDPQACPLTGGYVLGMFDKMRGQGVCDAWHGEVRLESECVPGDGLVFYFRTQKCVPEDLMMYNTQRALCLAHWTTAQYVYALLRHNQHPYFWVLRLPAASLTSNHSFTSYLYKDLFADTVEYSNETLNYIRLDMSRDVTRDMTSLCVDDYEICDQVTPPCVGSHAHLALTCPAKCGLCGAVHSYAPCELPSEWAGRWADRGGGGVVNADRARSVGINGTSLTVRGGAVNATYRCVQWSSAVGRNVKSGGGNGAESGAGSGAGNGAGSGVGSSVGNGEERMMVRTFAHGCRPRFTCAAALRRAPSLLYIKLSQPAAWPLTNAPNDPIDCSNFRYDMPHYGSQALLDLSVAASSALLLLPAADRRQPVACRLPADEYSNFGVSFRQGGGHAPADCHANLSAAAGTQTALTLVPINCPAGNQITEMQSFTCLDSFVINEATIIIAETPVERSRNRTRVYCWVFLKPTAQATNFLVLNVTQCHQAMRAGVRLDTIHHYVAMFSSRTRRKPGSMESTRQQETTTVASELVTPRRSTIQTTRVPRSSTTRRPVGVEPLPGGITEGDVASEEEELGGGGSIADETEGNGSHSRTRNGTVAGGDTVPAEPVSTNPIVISGAVVFLAVLQAVMLCMCGV